MQPQVSKHLLIMLNSSASVNHNSAQASPVLYKHYRRDNKRLDESRDEYTDYNRETLV